MHLGNTFWAYIIRCVEMATEITPKMARELIEFKERLERRLGGESGEKVNEVVKKAVDEFQPSGDHLSLIHIAEPTSPY